MWSFINFYSSRSIIRRIESRRMRWAEHAARMGDKKIVRVYMLLVDRLCGLVVRVLGYRSGGPGSIPGTTKKQ
jgi:hypothetical protein